MAVDTFGQMSPLVAFRESRPPSAAAAAGPPDSSAGRQQNNGNGGLKSGTPPQMYTTDATMAIEEYTGGQKKKLGRKSCLPRAPGAVTSWMGAMGNGQLEMAQIKTKIFISDMNLQII
jgi:hypothetical protein